MKTYSVYILANKMRNVLYIGVTNNLERRVSEHKNLLVEGFTKKYHVTELMYYEDYADINQAIAREKQIKSYRRAKKNALIVKDNPYWADLSLGWGLMLGDPSPPLTGGFGMTIGEKHRIMQILKTGTDFLLAVFAAGVLALLWCVPWRRASDMGGALTRTVGPRLALSRKIRRNLQYIYPDMPRVRQDEIIRGVWDNLGRNFAEFPHLHQLRFDGLNVAVTGAEDVQKLMQNRPVVFVTGHTGNWEIVSNYFGQQQAAVSPMYRRANNRFVDFIIQKIRSRTALQFMPKGKIGSKQMIESLSTGKHIILLLDQRMGDGEPIDFLGKPALTATGWLRLVQKYHCAIVPVRSIRHANRPLELRFENPILPEQLDLPSNPHQAVIVLANIVNGLYSEWVRQYPGQWLWLHRRWGKV